MATDLELRTTSSPSLGTLAKIPNPQIIGMMLAVAAMVALFSAAWMWSQAPDYRVLYSNLADRDGGAVVAALQQMNVPYKFADGGGALLVPAQQVHETRLRLASQGLPKGSVTGFELMENQKLGISQFLEQVNYQRAQEGELTRSIQSLSAVQSARVHLALAKPSVFAREAQKSTASVLLNLYPGKTLEAAQINAIVHLVASSVPDLPVKNVTVIDQNGGLLSASQDGNSTPQIDPNQQKYVLGLEQSYIKRVEAILTPIVGAENVRAQVTADVDFTQAENVAEIYKPNQNPADLVIRSQQTAESVTPAGAAAAGGIPGALSNQPPASTGAPIVGAGLPAKDASSPPPAATHKDATTHYEIDKIIRHVRNQVGTIKRLSVAVVVNHRKVTGTDGKVTFKPLSDEEMKQMNDLVKEAVGFNQERGDTLSVISNAFLVTPAEKIADTPWWKNPETIALAKDIGKHLLIAGVLIFLVMGVLRPLLKNLAAARQTEQLALENHAQHALDILPQGSHHSYDQNLQRAKQIAKQDPKIVANVVKDWVSGDGS